MVGAPKGPGQAIKGSARGFALVMGPQGGQSAPKIRPKGMAAKRAPQACANASCRKMGIDFQFMTVGLCLNDEHVMLI